jgi:tellurite resistance protein TerC
MVNTLRQVKRLVIAIVGSTVLLIGVAMIVLPGPAIVVIPVGLGILATEFAWARRILNRIKSTLYRKGTGNSGGTTRNEEPPETPKL